MVLKLMHLGTVRESWNGKRGHQEMDVAKLVDAEGECEAMFRWNLPVGAPKLKPQSIVQIRVKELGPGFNGSLRLRGDLMSGAGA